MRHSESGERRDGSKTRHAVGGPRDAPKRVRRGRSLRTADRGARLSQTPMTSKKEKKKGGREKANRGQLLIRLVSRRPGEKREKLTPDKMTQIDFRTF